jgi:hypothetical protein
MRILRLLIAFSILLVPVRGAAQVVTGVLAEADGRPVEQVLVALVDSAGHQRAAALTDGAGAFTIRAPAAGRYSLRAERIGYATVNSAAFVLRDGETRTQRLTASGRAVMLQALRVTAAGRRCSGRAAGSAETATLWEEARKALNATAYAERAGIVRYDVLRWTRDTDARSGRVLHDERRTITSTAERPFVSAPAEELSRRGYVRRVEGDSTTYWGPDAEVMLSDAFLNDHCFRVATGPDAALVGLAFEPVRGRPVADLAGTLWLDRRTAELRRVDYRYVGGPPESREPRVGGSVEYARAPGGAWIVRRWAIRMPLAQEARGATPASTSVTGMPAAARVLAIRESGGEVTSTYGAARLAASTPPVVMGVVWDSTRNAPLAGARVYLSGTQAEAVAEGDGRYRLAAPAEGTYTLAFSHPDMGPLAAAARPREVTLRAGAVDTANLAIPGWATLAPALCPDSTLHPHRGIVLGRVRGYAPGDTSLVSAVSDRKVISSAGIYAGTQFVATRPDADGFYVLCGVPENRPLQLGMRRRGIDEGGTEITVRSGVPARADISAEPRAVETGMNAALSGAMGMPARQPRRGTTALEGFERRRRGGRGIFLSRADVERRHAARLEDLFRGIPGLQVVGEGAGGRVVGPGQRPARPGAEIRGAAPLGDRPRDGHETRDAREVGDARVPVAPASEANACAVQFYLDGVYTPTEDGRISDRVRLEDVEAVEVYRGPSELPPEFRRPGADCGVIVVWTRRGSAAAHP